MAPLVLLAAVTAPAAAAHEVPYPSYAPLYDPLGSLPPETDHANLAPGHVQIFRERVEDPAKGTWNDRTVVLVPGHAVHVYSAGFDTTYTDASTDAESGHSVVAVYACAPTCAAVGWVAVTDSAYETRSETTTDAYDYHAIGATTPSAGVAFTSTGIRTEESGAPTYDYRQDRVQAYAAPASVQAWRAQETVGGTDTLVVQTYDPANGYRHVAVPLP